jgi:hypothetical protein
LDREKRLKVLGLQNPQCLRSIPTTNTVPFRPTLRSHITGHNDPERELVMEVMDINHSRPIYCLLSTPQNSIRRNVQNAIDTEEMLISSRSKIYKTRSWYLPPISCGNPSMSLQVWIAWCVIIPGVINRPLLTVNNPSRGAFTYLFSKRNLSPSRRVEGEPKAFPLVCRDVDLARPQKSVIYMMLQQCRCADSQTPR